jgi:hypothetical protein
MSQQTPRERGLRKAGLITAMLAAAGVVGSGAVAVLAHADTVAQRASTSTSGSTSTQTSTPTVNAGSGSAPQAQSAGT